MRTDSNICATSSNNTVNGSRLDGIKVCGFASARKVISWACSSTCNCVLDARNSAWRNVINGLAVDGGNKGSKSKSELHFGILKMRNRFFVGGIAFWSDPWLKICKMSSKAGALDFIVHRQGRMPRVVPFCKHVLSHLWPSQYIPTVTTLLPRIWIELHLSPHSEVVSSILMYAPQTDKMTEAVRLTDTQSLLNFRGHELFLKVTLSSFLPSFFF